MTVSVTIQVAYQKAVRQLAKLGVDLDPIVLLRAIGLRQIKWSTDNIKAGGLAMAWTRMSKNTIAANPKRSGPRFFSSRYTARLKQALTMNVQGSKSVQVGITDRFAEYHHFGTKPYVIRPVNARFLRFVVAGAVTSRAGRVVSFTTRTGRVVSFKAKTGTARYEKNVAFAREVHHPGLPARPLLPTKAIGEQLALMVLQARIDQAVQRSNQP